MMKEAGSTSPSAPGRFQRRPSLGTSIARAMISMSPDVNFDMTSEQSTSLSLHLSTSLQSSTSASTYFSPSTAVSHVRESTSTIQSSDE